MDRLRIALNIAHHLDVPVEELLSCAGSDQSVQKLKIGHPTKWPVGYLTPTFEWKKKCLHGFFQLPTWILSKLNFYPNAERIFHER